VYKGDGCCYFELWEDGSSCTGTPLLKHKISRLRTKELLFFKDNFNDVVQSMIDEGDNFSECNIPIGAGFRGVARRPLRMLSLKKWYRNASGQLLESNIGFFLYMEEWAKLYPSLSQLEQVMALHEIERCSERGDHQNQETAAACSFCNPESFHLAFSGDE
jgi:hypothetical protein